MDIKDGKVAIKGWKEVSALDCFDTQDTKDFFENEGVPLKTERGNRVFPVSDKSKTVVDALSNWAKSQGVKVINDILITKHLFKFGNVR